MDGVLAGLRPYVPGDTEAIIRLIDAAESWPPVGRPTAEELLARWARWHAFPERDVNVLPGPEGGLAAYSRASLATEPSTRLSFEIAVHPTWRRQGIGSALLSLVEERARNLQVGHITTPVYLAPEQTRPECTQFLAHRGFFADRSYWQMRLDNLAAQPRPEWPLGFTSRRFNDFETDSQRWAELIVRVFDEPASARRVAGQLSEPGSSPEGYIFAVDTRTGKEVGTSRCRIDLVGGREVGYIGTVGVLPEYRGRGLARALMLETVGYLASLGLQSSVLLVENTNHSARRLYQRMGWRPVYQTVHYWKVCPPSFT